MQALYAQLLVGLINGSFYALLSLGLAVIFGMLNIINFAHGALFMMGAFCSWMLLNYAGIGYFPALFLAPLIIGAFGLVLEKTIMSAPRLDSLTETVSVDTYGFSSITDEGNEAFKACLAVRLGPYYGKQADATTVNICTNAKEAITNASFDPDSVSADTDLPKVPSQRLVDY